jgi:hypothetical protein
MLNDCIELLNSLRNNDENPIRLRAAPRPDDEMRALYHGYQKKGKAEEPAQRELFQHLFEFRNKVKPQQYYCIDYRDLTKDPRATLEKLYEHFGWKMSDAFRAKLTAATEKQRDFKSSHNYTLEEFGLSKEWIFFELVVREHTGRVAEIAPVKEGIPYVDPEYCQYSEWGYQKPTRIWGDAITIAGMRSRLCDGVNCANLERPRERNKAGKHRITLSSEHQNLTVSLRYPIPGDLIYKLIDAPARAGQEDMVHSVQLPRETPKKLTIPQRLCCAVPITKLG